MERMIPPIPCTVCNGNGHKTSKCPELYLNKPPPPQKGGDEEEDSLTNSGNCEAQDFNQTSGSNAGHWNPLSVISM